jgi:hypothetical protein
VYHREGEVMKGNNNPNSRAILSALRCDHVSLRRAAVELIDKAALKHDSSKGHPNLAMMLAFDASRPTADKILRERARVTKTGARRP